jgi:hypothetical protein
MFSWRNNYYLVVEADLPHPLGDRVEAESVLVEEHAMHDLHVIGNDLGVDDGHVGDP